LFILVAYRGNFGLKGIPSSSWPNLAIENKLGECYDNLITKTFITKTSSQIISSIYNRVYKVYIL
jgi:hypothetical protein